MQLNRGSLTLYRENCQGYIVLKPGESVTEEEIIQFFEGRLAPYKVPRSVEFRQSLPRAWWERFSAKSYARKWLMHYEEQGGTRNA